MFSFAGRMDYDEKREADAWNALYTMVGPGRVVTPEEVASWRADIGRARQESQTMALLAVRFQQLVETSPFGTASKPHTTPSRIVSSICGPIGAAPLHYGNSLFTDGLAHARKTPIKSDFPSD